MADISITMPYTRWKLIVSLLEQVGDYMDRAGCNDVTDEIEALIDDKMLHDIAIENKMQPKDVLGYDWLIVGYLQKQIESQIKESHHA